MGTGQYRSFHTSARGFLCLFITDKIGQHILCGMPYACWDNRPWNTAVPFSPFRQIRGSSHLSFWKKPIGICRQNLQISGHKKPANSWYKRLSAYGIYTVCGFWRRWRDSNSRYPFEVYTISNRARSTSYATSPNVFHLYPERYYTSPPTKSQERKSYFSRRASFIL